MIRTIEWTDSGVVMLDQRRLPTEEIYNCYTEYTEVADAIRTMVIRGAPAIGVAAAMGVALGVRNAPAVSIAELDPQFEKICEVISVTRPTAVNLFWAIERMRQLYELHRARGVDEIKEALVREAQQIKESDVQANREIGRFGQELLPNDARVLTHCNAGALATAGYGTALGVIRAAVEAGKKVSVYADETRPFLQGARLTAWELAKDNIPVTVITDNMAGHIIRNENIDCVIVGADRIAANGDVANKIGTYSIAVLAKENEIPFYVAAPISTLDLNMAEGSQIPIEERDPIEVRQIQGISITPEMIEVRNPAFDVTPHTYVRAIITDRGIARPPYLETLSTLAASKTGSSSR